VTDSAGRRAAAAAIVLVVVWIATYWLWPSPGEGGPRVSIDDPQSAVVVGEPERSVNITPEPRESDLASPVIDPIREPREVEADPDEASDLRVEPPQFREYTVRRGDQIMTISQRVYGETRHWQAIAKANPSVDPQRLRAGQTLRIPVDPENVQGVVVGGESETPKPAQEPEAGVVEHIVQRNDSLWKIAASFYGDGTKWTIIRDANRDLVGAEGQKLRPGMTLVIPPAPNEAR
jgi:nucleoid-associated protein YgaU